LSQGLIEATGHIRRETGPGPCSRKVTRQWKEASLG
jgi:hypothetical protein